MTYRRLFRIFLIGSVLAERAFHGNTRRWMGKEASGEGRG